MSRSARPVRARKGSFEEDEKFALSDSASYADVADGNEMVASDYDDFPTEEEDDNDIQKNLRNVSFGALAEAQDSLTRQSLRAHRNTAHDRRAKRADISARTDAEKVNLLRDRLAELKKLKSEHAKASPEAPAPSLKRTFDQSKDHSRSSKHAPAEQSSRRAVPRYRPVIDIAQDPYHSRDPRFSYTSTGQQPQNDERAKKRYAFLGEYRDSELSNLKDTLAGLKQRKNKRKSKMLTEGEEEEVQELRRNINSIENKKKSEASVERQKEIVRSHKKEEKEKIKQGKKPYFLKNSELKERAEKERFEGMKAKEKEKIMDRRRKKQSQREKRAMPNQRRLPNG